MKTLQKSRMGVQLLFLIISIIGLLIDVQLFFKLFILVSTLSAGVFYCGWLCPYGTIQDFASKLGKLLGIKKRVMPKKLHGILIYLRYIILILVTIIAADIIFTIMSFDPRANFDMALMGRGATIGTIIVMTVFAVISLFYDRPFCSYLCQEGARYGVISFFRVFRIRRDDGNCISCGKCDKVCPMHIEVSTKECVSSTQCINCMECISACPVEHTLSYSKANKHSLKKMVSIKTLIAITVLFIVFSQGREELERKEEITPIETTNDKINSDVVEITDVEIDSTLDEVKSNIIEVVEVVELVENTREQDNTYVIEQTSQIVETSIDQGSADVTTPIEEGLYQDGVYNGEAMAFRGMMKVAVTVEGGAITAVEVTDHIDDLRWFNYAVNYIPSWIIESQSTDVDVVGGATYSSLGIINGAKDALGE